MSTWEVLSKIDCNAHVDKKGNFSYLSWTWSWAMVKERFPEAIYTIDDDVIYPDGTREVRCTVTIDGLSHQMWLPVLNNQNKAIANPNSFDVNSSRMRCLVKNFAMFGLGHYIYAGESLPQQEVSETASSDPYTPEQLASFKMFLANDDPLGFLEFTKQVGEDVYTALHNSGEPKLKVALKNSTADMETRAHARLDEYAFQISEELAVDDPHAMVLGSEVSEHGAWVKRALWERLSEDDRQKFTTMKKEGAP